MSLSRCVLSKEMLCKINSADKNNCQRRCHSANIFAVSKINFGSLIPKSINAIANNAPNKGGEKICLKA